MTMKSPASNDSPKMDIIINPAGTPKYYCDLTPRLDLFALNFDKGWERFKENLPPDEGIFLAMKAREMGFDVVAFPTSVSQ